MKKLLTVLGIAVLFCTLTFATNAGGTKEWVGIYGGTGIEYAYDIEKTSDGGYVTAGSISTGNGDFDYWIVKTDSMGNQEWEYTYGGSGNDKAYDIEQTSDGGYIVAGTSNSTDGIILGMPVHGGNEYWILKLTAEGTLYWQGVYGGDGDDSAFSVEQTDDNGYIVAGYSYSNDGDVSGGYLYANYWLVKLGEFGLIEWEKTYGGSLDDFARDVKVT